MLRLWLVGIVGLGVVACTSAAARVPPPDDERRSFDYRALDRTLVAGTLVEATIHRGLSRRRNVPGATLTATVNADVRNAHHWAVIPAGCTVALKVASGGKMLFDITSVTVQGVAYPVNATIALAPGAALRGAGDVVVAAGTRILFVLPEGFTTARQGETP